MANTTKRKKKPNPHEGHRERLKETSKKGSYIKRKEITMSNDQSYNKKYSK